MTLKLEQLVCAYCHRTPSQIPGYVVCAEENGLASAEEYVMREEGTLNTTNGHFACDECYCRIGMPSAPFPGWKAP